MAEFLSYVEAIPMEVLNTIEVDWETFPQYMDRLDRHLGVNVGTLIGHTAVRYYVMGEECQKRAATDAELKEMQGVVRDGMEGGALGLSVSRNKGHYDPQGVHIPALWADEKEIFALADVLREMGTGIIQSGGGRDAEMDDGLMARLSEATGRPVVYNNLGQSVRRPGEWKKHMDRVDETSRQGIRAYPLASPNTTTQTFNMANTQVFRGSPTWHPILLASRRGEAAGLCRPGGAREIARRDGRVEGRDPRQHDLARMVQLHLGRGAEARQEQVDAGQDAQPDRPGAGQRDHRRVSRPGGRGRARRRCSCRPKTTSTSRR